MSKPVNISSPKASQTPLAGTPARSVGESLRVQYLGTTPPPNIPPRAGTPHLADRALIGTSVSSNASVPSTQVGGISAGRPTTPASQDPVSSSQAVGVDDLSDEAKAKVLRKHLVSKDERSGTPASLDGPSTSGRPPSFVSPPTREDSEPFPVPYEAPGADVVHDIYKWQQGQRRTGRRRSVSFAGSTRTAPDPAFEHIHEPGGFRRNYLLLQQSSQEPGDDRRMLNNFIDFLYIFGHFAGEDLEEIEEEDEEQLLDEESGYSRTSGFAPAGGDMHHVEPFPVRIGAPEPSEHSPLLERGKSRSASRRRRLSSVGHGEHGDATVGQAILMLLKSFVGTGVLFLGKAFFNGGLLFSTITLSAIALISLYSFLLLVETKFIVSGSFGDIGGALYGPWMRYTILTSIAVSQIGFVSAYTIFVAENLQAFVMAITNCAQFIPTVYIILMQLVVFLPLALIRNLAKLSVTVLIADAFILAGLIYVFGSEVSIIANRGVADVAMFNPKDFPLLIGTAVFSFEGIGLVIPITDAMREPHKFPAVLSGVMIGLLFLFGGAGALSYLTFGSEIKTVVLVNLDSSSRLTQIVQFLYSLAILLSVPLQLFPAVRIMENGLFTRSGKTDYRVKWQKNVFRFLCVMGCTFISWIGASDLDKFVAFIGSFACVPLCFVYPAMLHYKACARTRTQKAADIALGVFGLLAAAYTTVQTVRLMATPEPAAPPVFGCKSSVP
ncbi:transmembrane amino acid transporter protein-domain-containing protein [Vararia minispora EC-137]|uniref:Transmembrane amino acid transporter protein-domain-containing protein n=1 Tax=Vararia minispora EC-137 TaxID=1314806 RepID=A0ACB8QBV5_9AGAM|nr:transmembrane amino acid transporter protein-domain-containing protein [Vararia minispora EC-137]